MPNGTTNDSLQRWCLRALHQSCEAMQHRASQVSPTGTADYAPIHLGPPPLCYSCIAPYCEEWSDEGDGQGFCRYEQMHGVQRPEPNIGLACDSGIKPASDGR